jgi:hypothetical protein
MYDPRIHPIYCTNYNTYLSKAKTKVQQFYYSLKCLKKNSSKIQFSTKKFNRVTTCLLHKNQICMSKPYHKQQCRRWMWNKGCVTLWPCRLHWKVYERQKEIYGNSNISPCKNIIFKKSSKRNRNPSRYYNSITNLKFQHKSKYHLSKILI